MKSKPVIPRGQVRRDVDEALTFYLNEGAASAALGMIDALEKAYAHIARHPATGSPHNAHELNLPHLRVCSLKRYPYLVFYMEQPDHIDVWRLLHEHRDIPMSLQEASD